MPFVIPEENETHYISSSVAGCAIGKGENIATIFNKLSGQDIAYGKDLKSDLEGNLHGKAELAETGIIPDSALEEDAKFTIEANSYQDVNEENVSTCTITEKGGDKYVYELEETAPEEPPAEEQSSFIQKFNPFG